LIVVKYAFEKADPEGKPHLYGRTETFLRTGRNTAVMLHDE
jgi:hypothetical protein